MNPLNRTDLAEICGIFAGDGTLYKTRGGTVLEVRGGLDETEYYENHVRCLFGKLFSCNLLTIRRKYKGGCSIGIRKCGKTVAELFHIKLGFPIGKKSDVVKVPNFIIDSKVPEIWISYLRGVFDTDGCIYLNKNKKGKKFYIQPRIHFTSKSINHLVQIRSLLTKLGFNSHIEKSNFKVTLGGWSTSEKFLRTIKPANGRHSKRIKILMPRLFNMLRWPKV